MSYDAARQSPRRCCRTGRELKPGDVYYAALVRRSDGSLERLDFAPEAWTGPPEGAIGYWRGRVPQRRQPRRRLDDQTAFELFQRLPDASDDPRIPLARYLLALHLMRRRILRLVRIESHHGQDYIRLRHTREKTREWAVWCPPLNENQVLELEGQLEEILAPLIDNPNAHAA